MASPLAPRSPLRPGESPLLSSLFVLLLEQPPPAPALTPAARGALGRQLSFALDGALVAPGDELTVRAPGGRTRVAAVSSAPACTAARRGRVEGGTTTVTLVSAEAGGAGDGARAAAGAGAVASPWRTPVPGAASPARVATPPPAPPRFAVSAGASVAPAAAAPAPARVADASFEPALSQLRDRVLAPSLRPALAAALRLAPPRGVLLHGPPGTGKTALVHALARAVADAEAAARASSAPSTATAAAAPAPTPLFVVTVGDVAGGGEGEREARVRAVFRAAGAAAALSPLRLSLLLLDDVDALAPRRAGVGPAGGKVGSGDASVGAARAVAQLLTLLDGASGGGGGEGIAGDDADVGGDREDGLDARESTPASSTALPGRVVVLATTSRVGDVDPALRRPGRLDVEVLVGPPDARARARILSALLERAAAASRGGAADAADAADDDKASVVDATAIHELAEDAVGFVGADLAALVDAAVRAARGGRVTRAHLAAARAAGGAASLRGAPPPPPAGGGWADLGGLDGPIERLRRSVLAPLGAPARHAALGVAPPRGVLLHGPPGTGKTALVRALAGAARAAFLTLTPADVLSAYVGDAEAALRAAFARARAAAPCVLFLDEVDALVGRRDGGGSGGGGGGDGGVSRGLLATLLTEMDGVAGAGGVVVVGATNRPGALDPALLRPGRLEVHIAVPPPDAAGRAAVLRARTRATPLAADVDLDALARAPEADGLTGAELDGVLSSAGVPSTSKTADADVPYTPAGVRAEKSARLAAARKGASFAPSVASNSLKEEVVIEYADNFRRQFEALYPDRRPLLLSIPNEAGCLKFVCTAIRPTRLPALALYDAAAAARFVAARVAYEPLEAPAALPPALTSPAFTLAARAGDCLDASVALVSLLAGNGLDAFVVVGTAPRWVTLKQTDKARADVRVPPDAIDVATHADPARLASDSPAPPPVAGAAPMRGLAARAPAAAALGGGKPPAGAAAAAAAAAAPPAVNRYKLPPPAKLESAWLAKSAAAEAAERAAAAAAASLDSGDEGEDEELARTRLGYATRAAARAAGARAPDTDPLAGERLHAWVLVRARDSPGGRQVPAPFFLEPSTGAVFPVDASPYLAVEAVFNHKNYWVNMQGQSPIPQQDAGPGGAGRAGPPATPYGSGDPLADSFRAALNSRGAHVRGGGGGLAVAATAATLEGPLGGALAGVVRRPDVLSPFMATVVATKAMADPRGDPNLQLDYNFHAGAPRLAGAATAWTLANPLPAVGAPPPAAAAPAPAAAAAADGAGAPAADGGEGGGEGGAAGGDGAPPAAADGAADAAGGAPDAPGAAGAAAARPPSAPAPPPSAGGAAAAAAAASAPAPESRASSRGASRSSSRMRGPRAPSRGGHVPGSLASWRVVLNRQALALQAEAAAAVAATQRAPTVAQLRWDVDDSSDWEYVLIPYEKHTGDEHDHGDHHGHDFGAVEAVEAGDAADAGGGGGGGDGKADAPPGEGSGGGGGGAAGDSSESGGGGPGEGGAAPAAAAAGSSAAASPASRPPSGAAARKPPVKDKFAGIVVEADGEHLLDLPASWCPRFTVDRHAAEAPLGDDAGGGGEATTLHFRARVDLIDRFVSPLGVETRLTTYADAARTAVVAETTLFERRRDLLVKRVVRPGGGASGAPCVVEEHFARGRPGGLALIVDTLGRDRRYYYYAGARVDGLLARVETIGVKFADYFGETPSRVWYRSVTLADGPLRGAAAAAADTARGGGYTVETEHKVEAGVRKMAEKFRRNPAVPAGADPAKVVYDVAAGVITVRYHAAPGRLSRTARAYSRATGAATVLSADALEPPAQAPHEREAEFRRLLGAEKDCATAVRAASRAAIELRVSRAWDLRHSEVERVGHDAALLRARAGFQLEEEVETKQEDPHAVTDLLMPFLLSAKVADVNAPNEKEAKKANRDARIAYKEMLIAREGIISHRLAEEKEKLMRRQQAFSRTREHTLSETTAFESFVADATFKIAILEQRLARHRDAAPARIAAFDKTLEADPRLAAIYNPTLYKLRQEAKE